MRVEIYPGLERQVTTRILRPFLDDLGGRIQRDAARRAPNGKMWVTAEDERVRLSHDDAHGQLVPANLRFKLVKAVYVRKGRDQRGKAVNRAGGWKRMRGHDLARRPRDEELPIHQKIHCRCEAVPVPGVVGRSIRCGPVRVEGAKASVQVYTRFPRAAESEFGTSRDRAARFMRDALQAAARRYRR